MPAHTADMGERLRNSHAYRDAERELDFWAVVLFGTTRRIPRDFGDNRGVWPARVGLTQRPEDYAARTDLDAGAVHEYAALEWVWVESKRHATRLQAEMDRLLLGDGEANRLRHKFRDIGDPQVDWPILLGEALNAIEARGEVVECFDGESKHRRILERMIAHHGVKRRSR